MKKISKRSLHDEVLDDLIDGADIDGDGIIDYKKHLNLIANTLLQLNVSGNQELFRKIADESSEQGAELSYHDVLALTDIPNMFDPKGYRRNLQEIDLNDNKRISYVEFVLILLQQNLDMMRSEKPLAKTFRGADIDGNSTMTPMEFMTWFEKNYGRMVRRGIRPRVSEERLYELACEAWMKIDVDGSGEIDYDEFIAAIVQQKITNY